MTIILYQSLTGNNPSVVLSIKHYPSVGFAIKHCPSVGLSSVHPSNVRHFSRTWFVSRTWTPSCGPIGGKWRHSPALRRFHRYDAAVFSEVGSR